MDSISIFISISYVSHHSLTHPQHFPHICPSLFPSSLWSLTSTQWSPSSPGGFTNSLVQLPVRYTSYVLNKFLHHSIQHNIPHLHTTEHELLIPQSSLSALFSGSIQNSGGPCLLQESNADNFWKTNVMEVMTFPLCSFWIFK